MDGWGRRVHNRIHIHGMSFADGWCVCPLPCQTDLLQTIEVEHETDGRGSPVSPGLATQAEELYGQPKEPAKEPASGAEDLFEGLGEDGGGNALEREDSRRMKKSRGLEMAPRALGCLGLQHPVRVLARRIAESIYFEELVFVCILASTIALAVDNKFIGKGSTLDLILTYSDYVINVIFTAELVVKVLSCTYWLARAHMHTQTFNCKPVRARMPPMP